MQYQAIVNVEKFDGKFIATCIETGQDLSSEIYYNARRKAADGGYRLGYTGTQWRKVSENDTVAKPEPVVPTSVPADQAAMMQAIHSSFDLKPKALVMNELKWKYLMRSCMRGKNIMMTGPAGCGKTMAAKAAITALDRPQFYFNLGATQDPRATLVGNTHFNKESGTYFSESLFVQAIRTPNAVVLLDELSRAHPDAWNILMTVLDEGQRYLRLDETDNCETVQVAEGVTFIATANVGNEYTSTRVMDKALMDRFITVEMDVLNEGEEQGLLEYMFPNVDPTVLTSVAKIAHLTRTESASETARIPYGVSTRTTVEMAGLLYDGFSLPEVSEVCIYPQYDAAGGADSERTFVKQIVQKFCDDGSSDDLFDAEEVAEAAE